MRNLNTLQKFLNDKSMYYDKIDYQIIKTSWETISKYINLPYVIHIIGTNGKGSTGRYIADFIRQNNKSVLHYSSPHILKFNERIWINGDDVDDITLDKSHQKLQDILDTELLKKLTYFEYTTLLALVLSSNKDYLVLEAGLGGQFDATNIIKNDLTVVPSIDIDHIEFLGDNIKDIATTKLKSCDNSYIFGLNMPKDVPIIEKKILLNKKRIDFDNNIDILNETIILPQYLKNNQLLALNVIKYLNMDIVNLILPKLFGRYQQIDSNIFIDVGHNLLSAQAIKNEFKDEKIILVYNSKKEKDYKNILIYLKPIIQKIEIINCDDNSMCNYDILSILCDKLNIDVDIFDYKNISQSNKYLVFGSFKTVEIFLKQKDIYER